MRLGQNRQVQALTGGDDAADAEMIINNLLPQSNGPRGRRGLFSQAGALVRCEEVGGEGYGPERLHGPIPATPSEVKLAVEVDWSFQKPGRGGVPVVCSLSREIVASVMSRGEWPQAAIPELRGASEWVTARPDGSLVRENGYDPQTGVYVRMDAAVRKGVDLVMDTPLPEHVDSALRWLQVELLGDFEWESPADAANALGVILTGAVRHCLGDSTVPLVLLDATTAMSGKGTLAAIIQKMSGVAKPDVRSFPKDDDELSKSIMSTLRSSANAVIVWDNVERVIEGDTLAALLTSFVFKRRLLKGNDDFVGINDRIWCATGNNMRLGKDIRRRSIRVRQHPSTDPRDGKRSFRHPDMAGWMDEKKDALAWAVGTLVRAWAVAGCPGFSDARTLERMASYKPWVNVVGGILETVGVEGFLGNVAELQYDDDATLELADFIEAVEKLVGTSRFRPQDLASRFNDAAPDVQDALPGHLRGKGILVNVTTTAMRKYLSSIHDRPAGLPGNRVISEAGLDGRTLCYKVNVSDEPVTQSISGTYASYGS